MNWFRNKYRGFKRKWKLFWSINWIKTIYFNYKMFPYKTGRKLPVYFFGKVKFSNLSGKILIKAPIETAMIGFGQNFEFPSTSKGTAELFLAGTWVFKGRAQIGKDFAIKIEEGAECEIGYMAFLGSQVKIVCTERITIGEWTGIGYESQVMDTNSHVYKNIVTGETYPMQAPIEIGGHNAISNRVTILMKTKTPDNCIIASNTLCNKNYKNFGENILIGGIPAKLLAENFNRDWENEKKLFMQNRIFRW